MRTVNNIHAILLLSGLALLAACGREPPPRSVHDFLDNPIILEAAMVRCAQNRSESRYDLECVNARQAVSIIEAREERARADALELQSERKREALRRTQRAAAEARRRAAEAERLRKEAEYLAQFGELPPPANNDGVGDNAANAPVAEIPDSAEARDSVTVIFDAVPTAADDASAPTASDGGNAPIAKTEPDSDLNAVRDELRRRSEETNN